MNIITTIAIICCVLFVTAFVYFKKRKNKVENEAKDEVFQILANMFHISKAEIEQFNITNIAQMVTIIQIIIKSIGNTTEILQIKSNTNFEEIVDTCMEFSKKRCQDLDILLDDGKQELILKLIKSYLTSHTIDEN